MQLDDSRYLAVIIAGLFGWGSGSTFLMLAYLAVLVVTRTAWHAVLDENRSAR